MPNKTSIAVTVTGVTAVTVGLGFLSEAARQRFFGYSIGDLPGVPYYLLTAGTLALDSGVAVLSVLSDYFIVTVFVLVIAGVVAWLHQQKKWTRLSKAVQIGAVMLSIALLLARVVLVDVPAIRVENVLGRDINGQERTSGVNPLSITTRWMWSDQVCSRVPDIEPEIQVESRIHCAGSVHGPQTRLRNRFFLALFSTVLTIIFAVSTLRAARSSKATSRKPQATVIAWAFGILGLYSIAVLPFAYVTVQQSTVVDLAELHEPNKLPVHVMILARTGEHLVYIDRDLYRIVRVSNTSEKVRIVGQQDLLQWYFAESAQRVRESLTPPGVGSESSTSFSQTTI